MKYFIPSNAFVNAIKNEDKIAIKAVLVGIIGTDPTFATTEYEEAIAYIKAKSEKMNGSALNLSEIYNKLDGEYELAKESWDEKYYHMLLVWYQDNYAEKRLNHIKAVGKEVYKNKSTLGKSKCNDKLMAQKQAARNKQNNTKSPKKDMVVMAAGNDAEHTRLHVGKWIKKNLKWVVFFIIVIAAFIFWHYNK